MNIPLSTAKQQFMLDQELKGNSPKTIKAYSNNIRYFTDYVGEDKPTNELTLDDLKNYLISLRTKPKLQNHQFKPKKEKPISSISIQTYIRGLRVFLKWMHTEGYINENLQEQFKLPKAAKKTVEILSEEEIETIMKCYKVDTELGCRNACIIALMIDCGLRRTEVITLDYDNVHISQGIIKVKGKGNKERIVPLGVYTKKLLLKYLSTFRPLPIIDSNRLFIDKNLRPMSDTALKQLFCRLRKRTKIKRLHPHILRHTFATKYLMNGGDIFSLQQILGHTSLEMVRRYSHLASSYITDNHKKYSPLDNIYMRRKDT